MSTRLRRGFNRLGILLTGVWMVCLSTVGVYEYVEREPSFFWQEAREPFDPDKYLAETTKPRTGIRVPGSDLPSAHMQLAFRRERAFVLFVLIPLLSWCFAFAIAWVMRGFKSDEH